MTQGTKPMVFQQNTSPKKLSIETLLVVFKPVVTQNAEFLYRDEMIFSEKIGTFDFSDSYDSHSSTDFHHFSIKFHTKRGSRFN